MKAIGEMESLAWDLLTIGLGLAGGGMEDSAERAFP